MAIEEDSCDVTSSKYISNKTKAYSSEKRFFEGKFLLKESFDSKSNFLGTYDNDESNAIVSSDRLLFNTQLNDQIIDHRSNKKPKNDKFSLFLKEKLQLSSEREFD